MDRNDFCKLFAAFFMAAALFYCRSYKSAIDVPEISYDGFIIQDEFKGLDIKVCLLFIKTNEKKIYSLLKIFVKKIQYSPYYYSRSFPYYDTINISEFSLERGVVHASSVIIHELYHIIFQKIRNDKRIFGNSLKKFLNEKGITLHDILKMTSEREEKLIYRLQLDFILKYGGKKDIDYQKKRMKKMRYADN